MLGLQDVQAIQTKLDAHIRQCEDFKAIIEERNRFIDDQFKVLRDRDAEIKVLRDQNAEIKVLRDRIQELEIELEGHTALFQCPVNTFPA
jgi:cell shape-determining protein MreC